MRTTTRSGLAVVAAAMATALVGWAVIRLLGVDLTLEEGAPMSQVGAVDVLLGSLADGISAVALICLHVLVGVVLIMGFLRFVPRPYPGASQAVDHSQYRG